jgi:hypothetical protein
MQFSIDRLNVTYEVAFKDPAFEIAQSAVAILTAFYQRLHPRFGVPLSDLRVLGGNALSELGVRIGLFNGQGLLEVATEKFSGSFQGLRNQQDITVVKDCIALSEEALSESLPDLKPKLTAIKTSSWLNCDGGKSGVNEVLEQIENSVVGMAAKKLGATNVSHTLRSQLGNEGEGWTLAFGMERSLVPGSDFFVVCDGTFTDGGRYAGLEERAEHVRAMYVGILGVVGLELQPSSSEE